MPFGMWGWVDGWPRTQVSASFLMSALVVVAENGGR